MIERRPGSDEPDAAYQCGDEDPGFDAFERLTEKLIRFRPPPGVSAPNVHVYGYAPEILFTADSPDGRLFFTIDAKLVIKPGEPEPLQRVDPPVFVLIIDDTVDEAGEVSEHPSIEEAQAHAAGETGITDLEWRPYVGYPDDAG